MIALGFLLLAVAGTGPEDASPSQDYAWRQAIQGTVQSGQVYRVNVSPEIFDACSAFPADVRIVDGSGREWPFFTWVRTADVEQVELQLSEIPSADKKVGVQSVMLDAGVRHRPLERLVIGVAETNFARPVKVMGRNNPTNQWRWIADGGLHQIDGDLRKSVELHGADYRWLRLDLYGYESPDVHVTNAAAICHPWQLVFEAWGEQPAFVYFSTHRLVFPRYDLKRRTPPELVDQAPELQLGGRRMNPERIALGLGSYGRWLGIAGGAVIAGLIFVIVGKLWRARLSDAA